MLLSFTGLYDLPVKLLLRHQLVPRVSRWRASFGTVEARQAPDLQEALLNHTMSCTRTCRPAAHPDSALTGGKPA